MFLRPYKRLKDGKEHTYYALVESERTPAGPRQGIVAYLGELNHEQERHWQRTVDFYNRHGDTQQLRIFPEDEDVVLPDDPDIVRIRLKGLVPIDPEQFCASRSRTAEGYNFPKTDPSGGNPMSKQSVKPSVVEPW